MLNNGLPNRRALLYFISFIAVVFVILSVFYWKALLSPVSSTGQIKEVSINIPKNTTSIGIGLLLQKEGLIRSTKVFSLYTRLKGLDQKLKPGRYLLNTGQSIPGMVGILAEGPADIFVFTVPEGYSLAQLTDLLERKGLIDKEQWKEILAQPEKFNNVFLNEIPANIGMEGYLFPDTYYVGNEIGEEQIAKIMLDRFKAEIEDLDYRRRALELGLTLHQAVTIASMVEGEVAVDEERPLVASVIFNRLKIGMPLQIDATVKYALGGEREKIYYKDLEVQSPYNTYRISGLPPGPINSPGRASLLATITPAQTVYLYYVAKPDGTHAFSSSLAEHNSNISKYQQ